MKVTHTKLLFVVLAGVCFLVNIPFVFAIDYLFENSAPVAQHNKKRSSVTFPVSSETPLKNKNPESGLQEMVMGVFFVPLGTTEEQKIDKEALGYNAIERCSKSSVELDEVYHDTPGSEALNLVIYDPRYSSENRKAGKYDGVAVPWDPLYDVSAGSLTVDAQMQDLARVLAPDCLPARFRFVYIGSKRYQEIRYGEKAWEKEAPTTESAK